MEKYILPDVSDSRNQIRKADEFLFFSREKVNFNQCDKNLSSGASLLWKKAVKSLSLHFYYGALEEHLFKFTLGMVALQRSLLENAGVLLPCHESEYYLLSQQFTYRQGW